MSRRVTDFVLYIVIGLTLGAVVLWFADRGVPRDDFGRWGGLALFGAILLGSVAANDRDALGRPAFLSVLGVLFAAHLAVFAIALRGVEHWKIIWFALIYPIELLAIEAGLSYLGYRPRRR